MSGLFEELKRRNVLRVGIAYLVASWLLLQLTEVIGPILLLPESLSRYLLFLLVVGLLPALILAWIFGLTPERVEQESVKDASRPKTRQAGRKLDRAIMVAMALALALLLFDWFTPTAPRQDLSTAAAESPSRIVESQPLAATLTKSVAVLPFAVMSTGPDDDYFADGLTEEIINTLAQVPDLLVTARTSAFHFKGQNPPVADIARQLGVEHVVEGSVRRAGEQLRITAQLIRTRDGFDLWSETYDRRTGDTLAVQTDIAEKVAGALNIYLDDPLRQRMRRVGTRNAEAFIAFQKGIEFYERAHTEPNQISLLRQANAYFDQAIGQAPERVESYVYHADLYSHILISRAAGQLDGEIAEADVVSAPAALVRDYAQETRYAKTTDQRSNVAFDSAMNLGPWSGLDRLSLQAAASRGCETALWLHLVVPLSSAPEAVLDAFRRMAACDPLRLRPMLHISGALLWLGRPDDAIDSARASLSKVQHPDLSRQLALALALRDDRVQADSAAKATITTEDELLLVQSMLAAIRGDSEASGRFEESYLGRYGPNDRESLVLEAVRGNRGEANRLAAAIDSRPFGHVVLLQAIYDCLCGAPFDLEAAPVFASMLAASGLEWPPAEPYDLPLKDW